MVELDTFEEVDSRVDDSPKDLAATSVIEEDLILIQSRELGPYGGDVKLLGRHVRGGNR